MKTSMTVGGFDDLDRKLAAMRPGLRDPLIVAALTAGGEVIADEERRLIPVRTGAGRDSIGVTTDASKVGGAVTLGKIEVYVGPIQQPDGPNLFYLEYVENGTSRAAAHPFVRPAFDAKHDEAVAVIAAKLADGIAEQTR